MYNINILPPKMRKKQKKIKIGNPTYAPFLFMGVIAAAVFLNFQIESKLDNIAEEKLLLQDEIKSVQASVDEVNNVVSQIQSAKQALTFVPEEMPGEPSGPMPSMAIKWDLLLDEISATTPPEVTITNIKHNETSGLIEVKANTYTLTHMARMKESFEKSDYFGSIDIPTLEQKHTNLLSRPLEVSFVLAFAYYPDGNKHEFPDAPPSAVPGEVPSPDGNNQNLTPEEREAQREAERESRRQSGTTPETAPPAGTTPTPPPATEQPVTAPADGTAPAPATTPVDGSVPAPATTPVAPAATPAAPPVTNTTTEGGTGQ